MFYELNQSLFDAASQGDVEGVRAALKQGARVDSTPNGTKTAAYISCQKGYLDILKVLRFNGADLNLQEKGTGMSMAHIASQNAHLEILEFLREESAKLTLQNANGKTALDLAIQYGHHDIRVWLERWAKKSDPIVTKT